MSWLLASALGVIALNVLVVVIAIVCAEIRERRERAWRLRHPF